MNHKSIAPSGTFVTNPLYRSVGAGDAKKRPPQPLQTSLDVHGSGHSGEPQELSDLSNLGLHEETSQTKSAPSQQRFSSHAPLDGSRIADSATEDDPEPAPLPAQTPPGSGPAVVQLSDDPAVAALQKSHVAMTCLLVTYVVCLNILESAQANPEYKLPANSFSYLRGVFTGLTQEGEARATALKTQTQQLLNQHSEAAKTLAAQAEGDALPVPTDTFSTGSGPAVAPVDLKQALHEVKQLPERTQQDQIIAGLQAALGDQGTLSDADLDKALDELQWELDNPHLKACDQELVGLYRQLNEDAQETLNAEVDEAFGAMAKSMSAIQFSDVDSDLDLLDLGSAPVHSQQGEPKLSTSLPPQKFFDEMDAHGTEAAPRKSQSTKESIATTGNPAPNTLRELDPDLDDLLKDLESQDNASKTAPHNIDSTKPSLAKPQQKPVVSSEERKRMQEEADAIIAELTNGAPLASQLMQSAAAKVQSTPASSETDELKKLIADAHVPKYKEWSKALNWASQTQAVIAQILTRELTNDEKAVKHRFTSNGGTEIAYRQELQKEFLRDAIKAQSQLIDSAGKDLKDIEMGTTMLNATLEEKKARVIELKGQIALASIQRSILLNTKL